MKIDLNMIGLVTADMAESLRFYKTLGLNTPEYSSEEPHLETTLPSGIRLAWDTLELIKQLEPDWVSPVGHRIGLAFLCENAAEVDSAHTKVTLAGFKSHKEPWDAFWGQRYAQVIDPDGNIVDLFAWLQPEGK
ncbi:MAG TPA: VOC family protein [Fimbriimonadaceae bacterium]|jgi:uncharacterized glyoxalase superfamily protein PhnB